MMRILLLGNFSGQAGEAGPPLLLDRDSFGEAMKTLAPKVEMGNGSLSFASLEDFEPESIYQRSELFAHLKERPLHVEMADGEAAQSLLPTAEQIARLISPGGLLDAMVEKTAEKRDLAEKITAPYSLPSENAESRRAATEREQRASVLLRQVLHEEHFQALEAAWRGLDLLVKRLDTDGFVQLFVCDAAKDRLRIEGKWDLVVVLYAFERSDAGDVRILMDLGSLGIPMVAEYQPSQAEHAEAWAELRQAAAGSHVALAMPRFLLRFPYKSAEFDEMPGKAVHTDYLWGNPALLCALVMGGEDEERQIEDLPVVGESCGEILLSDRDYGKLLEEGLTPVLSEKNADRMAIPKIQSVAGTALGL